MKHVMIAEPAEAPPDGPVLIAGHAQARYSFVVPAGLVRTAGMLKPEGATHPARVR